MAAVTLKEKAYVELRQLILSGKLEPGETLTERMLVEMLSMSRTPIRAALERLDAEGLAKYTPNKGLVVTELSLDKIVDFFDFRIAMECHVVRKLARRSMESELLHWFEHNLREQEQHVQNNDFEAFTAADSAFHLMLSKSYGNKEILHTMEHLQDRLHQVALKVLRKDVTRIGVSHQDHVRIFHCVKEGNGDEAHAVMEQHLEFGKRILIL